jgi:predicted acyltransferase
MSKTQTQRLLSLDVFRGITVALMILVNNPGNWGNIYVPLEHSKWNGCTPTDLVFPTFLFLVGVSIVYAMERKVANVANHSKLILGALRRGAILILISLAIQLVLHPSFEYLRFPGVLQRIGLVFFYLCGAIHKGVATPARLDLCDLISGLLYHYVLFAGARCWRV